MTQTNFSNIVFIIVDDLQSIYLMAHSDQSYYFQDSYPPSTLPS